MLRMEDGAKENTALNIQKPLEILVTDEDKHGTDIACMSDFFGIYIEQLSAELSNQVMRGVVEKIPAADVQILGELVHESQDRSKIMLELWFLMKMVRELKM